MNNDDIEHWYNEIDDGEEWYSNVLNVLLNTSDPRLDQVATQIYETVAFKGQKNKILNHIKVIILNFLVLKKTRPQGKIRYSRQNNYWTQYNLRMPNPWGISSKIDHVIDKLEEDGYVRKEIGFIKDNIRKQTRIQPTKKFTTDFITPHKLLELPLEHHKKAPLVRVNEKRYSKYQKEPYHIRYEAKGKTEIPNQLKQMKEQLMRYNTLIKKHDIRLEERPETEDAIKNINYDLSNRSYRVFADSEITRGGRIYGGWWQAINSQLRSYIVIDGKKTIELDYKSQHAHMIYGYCLRKNMNEVLGAGVDAYEIEGYPRSLGKSIFTTALNVRSRVHLKEALKNQLQRYLESDSKDKMDMAKECLFYINDDFENILDGFEALHEALLKPECFLYPSSRDKKWWGMFQFFDSQICAYILDYFTRKGIPCLSIHDSFIIAEEHEKILRRVMQEAYLKAEHIVDLSKCVPEIELKK